MWHAWELKENCTGFGGKAQRKETMEDQVVDGRMGSELILGT
jgi:hypothetical protein